MIRRPPRSTLFPLHDALPISVSRPVAQAHRMRVVSPPGVPGAAPWPVLLLHGEDDPADRKSTRLNSSHANISYAVFCLKKKTPPTTTLTASLSPRRPVLTGWR